MEQARPRQGKVQVGFGVMEDVKGRLERAGAVWLCTRHISGVFCSFLMTCKADKRPV